MFGVGRQWLRSVRCGDNSCLGGEQSLLEELLENYSTDRYSVKVTTTPVNPVKTTMKSVIAAAGIAAVGVFTAAAASADVAGLGTSETLVDGPLSTDYTVSAVRTFWFGRRTRRPTRSPVRRLTRRRTAKPAKACEPS